MTIANAEMASVWDGDEGEQWTEDAERYDAVALAYTRLLMAAAGISAGERVLDIGCGTGESTRLAARAATSGSALGVDLSARMLKRAQERSREEGITNADFVQADAQVHRFDESSFDVVISRFGAMFFNDPVAAFRNIASAVRPGGRLALLSWQELANNEWVASFRTALAAGRSLPTPPPGAPGPFGLADAAEVRRILGEAGLRDAALVNSDETMRFGTDAADAWPFVSSMGIVKGLTEGLDDGAKTYALDQLRQLLVAHEAEEGVVFHGSAWLITATVP